MSKKSNMKFPNKFHVWRAETGLKLKDFHAELERVTGAKINHTVFSRFHSGSRQLPENVAQYIVDTLRNLGFELEISDLFASPDEILQKGLSEDADPWEPPKNHELADIKLPLNQFFWIMKVNILDEIGIYAGDVIKFDMSPEAFSNLKSGDVVCVQKYSNEPGQTRTLIREYIKPNLLVNNSATAPLEILHTQRDDIQIKGVMMSSYRAAK